LTTGGVIRRKLAGPSVHSCEAGHGAPIPIWWLATLLFDLVFVWHRYIRHGAALASMVSLSTKGYGTPSCAKAISKAREMLSKPTRGSRSATAPKEFH
jgi:hypothetical protein